MNEVSKKVEAMERMSARTIYVILFVLTVLMVVATRTLVTHSV
jgi:hypothetical protein